MCFFRRFFRRIFHLLPFVLLAPVPSGLTAQSSPPVSRSGDEATPSQPGAGSGRAVFALEAVRLRTESIRLDGRLDEAVWATAPVATDFVQFEPTEGARATQRTEARVLYTADALYVGIRAFDSAPDSIVGQLTRRDQKSYSDEVGVVIDSYFDRRTAFDFAVNPVGVKRDVFRFDDVQEDAGWDAVWDVATSVDDQGWSAEFRIPYSQLRFRDAAEQTWGIQFMRRVARHQEISVWAPTRRSESAIVSRMGELRGLLDLEAPRRIEVMPYTLGRLERSPGNPANPFYAPNALSSAVGADVKIGVGGSLTLDLSVNPDFGQVEADPAQVNLTALETFLPERRPFFVEGANLFKFSMSLGDGDDAVETLFYSRRVGRSPQGAGPISGAFVDGSDHSTILGALKLSGKTPGGWSIGLLSAVTAEESSRVQPFDDGARYSVETEPLSAYSITRLSRDFRGGRSAVGVIGTALNRDRTVADALLLRRDAYSGGADFRHRFGGDEYQFGGFLVASRVSGSAEAIEATQRSSARYFQRPDADHLELDPTRTSLSGAGGALTLARIAGGHWRWAVGGEARSPGLETNDLGFLRETGYRNAFGYVGYDQSSPQGPFRRWRLNANGWGGSTWGWEGLKGGGNVNGSFQLANFWGGHVGVNYNTPALSTGLLRGGPAFQTETAWNGWGGLNSDARRVVQLNLNVNWSVRPESGSWRYSVGPNVSWRPSGRTSLSAGTSFNRNVDDRQWVRRLDTDAPHYLFARLDQTTFGLTGRIDHAFTPTLSLQLYAQPFVSAGSYDQFKRVLDPRAEVYADRFEATEVSKEPDGRYRTTLPGSSQAVTFRNPDFDARQFRSNTVLRWEYRPGSTLYLVWAQGRSFSGGEGAFDLGGNLRDLFSVQPENVLMIKASYWLNP